MKRLLSMILALVSCLALCLPAAAAVSDPLAFSMNNPGAEITRRGVADTFRLDLPADGTYHQVYPEGGGSIELTPGDVILRGTWSPTYARVSFKLIAADGGGISNSGAASGETVNLYSYYNSTYILYARAEDAPVSGTVQINIR